MSSPSSAPADWMFAPGYRVPAEQLLGVSVPDIEPGRARAVQSRVPGSGWSLGWLGVLVDAAGGRPLAATLPTNSRCPTVSMHLERVPGAPEVVAAPLTGHGTLLADRNGWALSRVLVEDGAARPIAVATARFRILRDVAAAEATVAAAHDVPGHDLAELLGLRPDGGGSLLFDARAAHANPYGVVHGGLHVAAADAAVSAEVTDQTLVGIDVAFHRPMPVDLPVSLTAATRYRGRTTALVELSATAPDGRVLTSARATFGVG